MDELKGPPFGRVRHFPSFTGQSEEELREEAANYLIQGEAPPTPLLSILYQQWNKSVERTPTCWIWIPERERGDYGKLWVSEERGTVLAHRLAYEFYIGPIPEGMLVLHKCYHKNCVNPKHLFLGTPKDVKRPRPNKLTSKQEDEVRGLYGTWRVGRRGKNQRGTWTMPALAKRYGVSVSTIAHIVRRESE